MNDDIARSKMSLMHQLHRAQQVATELFAELAGGLDITPRQLVVLHAIDLKSGQSQTDLVVRTGIDRSTLADIIRRLLRRGLIARKRTKQDARTYAVALSDTGIKLLQQTAPIGAQVDKLLLESVPASRRAQFLADLEQLSRPPRKR